ncbi:hypothetical protein B1218_36550 [Pseudomonas ogarae]|nr:hypothetical protein B1218_36550 [Pseudomonas ogarae]
MRVLQMWECQDDNGETARVAQQGRLCRRLLGIQGQHVREIDTPATQTNHSGRAIEWLHTRYGETRSIHSLPPMMKAGASALHQRIKAVTDRRRRQ